MIKTEWAKFSPINYLVRANGDMEYIGTQPETSVKVYKVMKDAQKKINSIFSKSCSIHRFPCILYIIWFPSQLQ